MSARYSTYLPELDHINVEDENLWKSGKFLVGLGGDHGITYPIVKALMNTGKKVGIIHLDSHYDNMPHHEGDEFARSTPFMRLYETEGVRNESLIHTGIKGPRNNPGGPVDGNGITSHELVTMIYEFGKRGVCGMDFVEVYPQQDANQNSAHFVSTAVLYVLAGHVHGGHAK